jgi:hypothetical protein
MKRFIQYFKESYVPVNITFVQQILYRIQKKADNIEFNDIDDVCKFLNKEFKAHNIIFEEPFDENESEDTGFRDVGLESAGFSYETDTIYIMCNDDILDIFYDDKTWVKFQKGLEVFIAHEMIHREQYKKIKANVSPEILKKVQSKMATNNLTLDEYLPIQMELVAFASEVVRDFKLNGYTKNDIEVFLRKPTKQLLNVSQSFKMYYEAYKDGIINKEVYNKYLKTVSKFVDGGF